MFLADLESEQELELIVAVSVERELYVSGLNDQLLLLFFAVNFPVDICCVLFRKIRNRVSLCCCDRPFLNSMQQLKLLFLAVVWTESEGVQHSHGGVACPAGSVGLIEAFIQDRRQVECFFQKSLDQLDVVPCGLLPPVFFEGFLPQFHSVFIATDQHLDLIDAGGGMDGILLEVSLGHIFGRIGFRVMRLGLQVSQLFCVQLKQLVVLFIDGHLLPSERIQDVIDDSLDSLQDRVEALVSYLDGQYLLENT